MMGMDLEEKKKLNELMVRTVEGEEIKRFKDVKELTVIFFKGMV